MAADVDYNVRRCEAPSDLPLVAAAPQGPKDDMVAEAAIAAGCDAVVTHNRSDFDELANFGVRVLSPSDFLHEIGGP